MIQLLPIEYSNLFEKYCLEKGKDINYRDGVSLSWETFTQDDCERLLLIGKVQSGKTAHFIGLTLRLFDSGFSTAIVFSGTKLNLHNQTLERFQSEFNSYGLNILSDDDPKLISKFSEGGRNVIICLKHAKRIDRLTRAPLVFSKVFIIDDESDQASLNGRNKENVLSGTLDITPTHHAIQMLVNTTSAKYLQITATPAGHLLTGLMDYFKPTYILGLKEHSNYFGNELLFENEDKIIKWIVEDPTSPTISNLIQFVAVHFENSFKLSLKDRNVKNISAFIHPHSRVSILRDYYDRTRNIVQSLISKPDEFIYHNSLLLSEFFKQNIHEIVNKIAINTEMTLVAGNYDKGINWEEYFIKNRFFILVGGGKLERGFTIEGLISTFMPRSQKVGNADTIQQRARFFGSKRNILEFLSVYVNEKTYNDFYEYYTNEKFIFDLVKYPMKSEYFKYNYITDYTNPCRDDVLYNFRQLIGTSWRHYYLRKDAEDFLYILGQLGFRKHLDNLNGYSCLIYTFNRREFMMAIERLDFLTFRDELSNKFGFLSSLELSESDDLQVIILGNEIKYRERSGMLRDGEHIPEMVHQGYSTNYPGDRNLYFSNRMTVQFSFVKLSNFNQEKLTVLSVKN
jgi:hypothetical protein